MQNELILQFSKIFNLLQNKNILSGSVERFNAYLLRELEVFSFIHLYAIKDYCVCNDKISYTNFREKIKRATLYNLSLFEKEKKNDYYKYLSYLYDTSHHIVSYSYAEVRKKYYDLLMMSNEIVYRKLADVVRTGDFDNYILDVEREVYNNVIEISSYNIAMAIWLYEIKAEDIDKFYIDISDERSCYAALAFVSNKWIKINNDITKDYLYV